MKYYTSVEDIFRQMNKELDEMPKLNILIVGKTGSGKSTLINSVFRESLAASGIGLPVTDHMEVYEKKHMPLRLYDTVGLEMSDSDIGAIVDEYKLYFEKTGTRPEIIWFTINANGSRIERSEIKLIDELSKLAPVIVVLTQTVSENAMRLGEYVRSLNTSAKAVVNVLAKDYALLGSSEIKSFGLIELVQISIEMLPENLKRSFANAQRVDIKMKEKLAKRWASRYIKTSFGIGFSPIPFSDASLLVPMQVTMLVHITSIYGLSPDKALISSIVAAIGGTAGATFLGRSMVTQALKFIPGAGTIVGGIISGSTASLITSSLAISYIKLMNILSAAENSGKLIPSSEVLDIMKKLYKDYLKFPKKTKEELKERDD